MTDTLISRAAFARQHGVSKTAVQKWEGRGLLVIIDGKVHVERSDRALMHAGAGRFSDRPRRAPATEVATSSVRGERESPPTAWDGQIKSLPMDARIVWAFVNRIAAHGGLTAWEVGAPLEMAQAADRLFRVLMIQAAAELLTELEHPAPGGGAWADVPLWSDQHMATIDWSAVAQAEPGQAHA